MKVTAILKQVLTMCETEQQGVIEGGLCESWREWLRHWFGIDAVLNVGLIDPEKAYFYTYGEPLKGIADAIITADGGAKVYVYEVEE